MADKGYNWLGWQLATIRATNWLLLMLWRMLVGIIGGVVRLLANRRARSIVDERARMIDRPGGPGKGSRR